MNDFETAHHFPPYHIGRPPRSCISAVYRFSYAFLIGSTINVGGRENISTFFTKEYKKKTRLFVKSSSCFSLL